MDSGRLAHSAEGACSTVAVVGRNSVRYFSTFSAGKIGWSGPLDVASALPSFGMCAVLPVGTPGWQFALLGLLGRRYC